MSLASQLLNRNNEDKTFEICNGCKEEVRSVGEDGISVCENCGVVEGETSWLTEKEIEELQ